jgi:hypothetical protein
MKGDENRKIRRWGFFVNSVPGQPEGYELGDVSPLPTMTNSFISVIL